MSPIGSSCVYLSRKDVLAHRHDPTDRGSSLELPSPSYGSGFEQLVDQE